MKAQELRVGNWVKRDSQPDGFVVDGASILRCERHEEWYEPIPLTPEWLEKFEFTKHDNHAHVVYSIDVPNDYGGQIRSWENDGIFKIVAQGCDDGCVGISYQYVHQLQNLYFALTGEELTIKEHATK